MIATLNLHELEAAFRRVLGRNDRKAPTVQAARNTLRRKGWTQAEAAKALGVTPIHLNYVLNARRESLRILNAIDHLPENPTPA